MAKKKRYDKKNDQGKADAPDSGDKKGPERGRKWQNKVGIFGNTETSEFLPPE